MVDDILNLLEMGVDPMIVTIVPEEQKFYFFEELQLLMERKKAEKEVDLSNLIRMVWTSTQNYDPDKRKEKPKAFNGTEIWKEWMEQRVRLISKLSKPLSFFDKQKLKNEGFDYFRKKRTVKTTETIKGQTFVSVKEV